MSYNPNIPQATDKILQSFFQLRANFQQINNSFSANHVSLVRDASIAGMHNNLTLRPQTGDPTTTATQIALYNKLVGGIPELFFRPNSDQAAIQLTYPSIKIDQSNDQYTFMAGPFIIYGGFIPAPTQGQVKTLTPGTTLLYVDLTMTNAKNLPGPALTTIAPTNITGTSFTIHFQNQGAGVTFDAYYFAIGV